MKILKTATQKNFIVNRSFYNESDLKELFNLGIAFCFSDKIDSTKLSLTFEYLEGREIRIAHYLCDRIEIRYLKEYGQYASVVVIKDEYCHDKKFKEIVVDL